jgi:hypothetical protein
MISAQEARKLMEAKRDITKDDFMARHSKFLEKLEKMIRAQCEKEKDDDNGHFTVIIHDYDEFERGDFEFLVKFLQGLKYTTRSGGNGDRNKTIEIWWDR